MNKKVWFLLLMLGGLVFWGCKKEKEDIFDDNTQMEVSLKIDTIIAHSYKSIIVKSTAAIFAANRHISLCNVDVCLDAAFRDVVIRSAGHTNPNNSDWGVHRTIAKIDTFKFTDTIRNLRPNTLYYFRIMGQVDGESYSTTYFYSTPVVKSLKYPLQIDKISPASGTYHDVVTIIGHGFGIDTASNKVNINGMRAQTIEVFDDSIRVLVPKKCNSGKVSVIVDGASVDGPTFEYIHYPYVVYTLAGSSAVGFAEGKGENALFNRPMGIAIDKSGNLFVADKNNFRIRKILPDGNVTTFCGSGIRGYFNGIGTSAKFIDLEQILVLDNNNILVSDGNCLRIVRADGSEVKTFSGDTISGYKNGLGTSARFSILGGMAQDKNGNIFIGDMKNNRVRKIDGFGEVTTFAGDGTTGVMEGLGTAAKMKNSYAVAFDSNGNCFVSGGDDSGGVIFKITPDGNVSIFAQKNNLILNYGICIDNQDNLYVASGAAIIKITPQGNLSVFAGIPGQYKTINGTLTNARFNLIQGMTMDSSGNLYITEDHCIRKIEKVD